MMHANYGTDDSVTKLVDTTDLWHMLSLNSKMGLQLGSRMIPPAIFSQDANLLLLMTVFQHLDLITMSPCTGPTSVLWMTSLAE